MDFDRSKHTLEATRDFARGPIAKKKGEALSKREIDGLDNGSVRNLVAVAQVAKPVGLDTESAKAANAAEAKADQAEAARTEAANAGKVDVAPVADNPADADAAAKGAKAGASK